MRIRLSCDVVTSDAAYSIDLPSLQRVVIGVQCFNEVTSISFISRHSPPLLTSRPSVPYRSLRSLQGTVRSVPLASHALWKERPVSVLLSEDD